MRNFLTIAVLFTTVFSVMYRWRYKILNVVLAIGFLRKTAVKLSMNIPGVRSKLLSKMMN